MFSSEVMEDGTIITASAQPLSRSSDNIIKLIRKNKQWHCKPRASAATATGLTDDTDMSECMQTCSSKFVATGVATGHADDAEVPQQSKKASKSFRMPTFDYNMTVLVKNSKWQVQIPEKLHGAKRVYIQFSAQAGTSREFGAFIFKRLQDVGNLWTDVKQAQMWCTNVEGRLAWKDHVQDDWLKSMVQKPEGNIDLEQILTGRLAYNACKGTKNGSVVRIPDYADNPEKWKTQKHHAIRVNQQQATAKKRAYVYLRFPRFLRSSSKFSMGERFGISSSWTNFVASYVRYALCNVDSLDALQRWCQNQLGHFRSRLQLLYCMYEKDKRLDFWEIRPSRVATDKRYVADGSFSVTSTGCGAGLFCKQAGEYEIPFAGSTITERVDKDTALVTKKGGFYQVSVSRNDRFVEVPTDASFAAKVVPIGFIVNHRVADPTHCLKVLSGQAILKPLRAAQKGEEFCFNYNYDLSDDVPTQES